MKCPHDGTEMERATRHGVGIDHCPSCGAVWLERGELDKLIEAVRPPVVQPDPAPPPPPPTLEPGKKAPKRESHARSFGGKYSRKEQIKSLIEEIFDFD